MEHNIRFSHPRLSLMTTIFQDYSHFQWGIISNSISQLTISLLTHPKPLTIMMYHALTFMWEIASLLIPTTTKLMIFAIHNVLIQLILFKLISLVKLAIILVPLALKVVHVIHVPLIDNSIQTPNVPVLITIINIILIVELAIILAKPVFIQGNISIADHVTQPWWEHTILQLTHAPVITAMKIYW